MNDTAVNTDQPASAWSITSAEFVSRSLRLVAETAAAAAVRARGATLATEALLAAASDEVAQEPAVQKLATLTAELTAVRERLRGARERLVQLLADGKAQDAADLHAGIQS